MQFIQNNINYVELGNDLIIAIHLSSDGNKEQYVHELSIIESLIEINNNKKRIFIIGDFNADLIINKYTNDICLNHWLEKPRAYTIKKLSSGDEHGVKNRTNKCKWCVLCIIDRSGIHGL